MTKQVKRIVYLVLSFMLVLTSILGVLRPASAAGASVTLSSLHAGDTVNFSGQTWIVLNPSTGYLLMQGFYGSERKFDPDSTNTFNPNDSNNLGYYLNNEFYNSLDSADRPLIQSHSWGIGNETDESSATEICNVGLISYSEWNTYSKYYNTSTGFLDNPTSYFWIRTPDFYSSDYVWVVDLDGSLGYSLANNGTCAVRPALYLKSDILVSGGNGGNVLGGKYHTVSVSGNPSSGGAVTGGGGAYAQNDQVMVTVAANTGYTFVNWTDENGIPVSTNASYSYTMGTTDKILVANFQNTCTPTITVVNGVPFSVTVRNTYGTLTGTNSTYGTLTGTASGNDTVISGTLTGLSTTTPTDITLGNGTIEIKAVNPPSTTLVNASFY
jgi:hypothetical protein